jgi:predicted Fe-Mo cluster-binding NifX family protein
MPPRKLTAKPSQGINEDEDQRFKKVKMAYNEEIKEHENDKDAIKKLIQNNQVDLIVVGGNKLETR